MEIDPNLTEEHLTVLMAETFVDRRNMVLSKKTISSIFKKYPVLADFSGSMVNTIIKL